MSLPKGRRYQRQSFPRNKLGTLPAVRTRTKNRDMSNVPEPSSESHSEVNDMIKLDRDTIQILLVQLRKNEGLDPSKIAKKIDANYGEMVLYLHHGEENPDVHNKLVAFLHVKMEQYGRKGSPLMLTREELRAAGYGPRTGTNNRVDPDVAVLSEKLTEYARAHGLGKTQMSSKFTIPRATLQGMIPNADGKLTLPKTIFPRIKFQLEKWVQEVYEPWKNGGPTDESGHDLSGDRLVMLDEVVKQTEQENPDLVVGWAEDRLGPHFKDDSIAFKTILSVLEHGTEHPWSVLQAVRAYYRSRYLHIEND